MRSEQILDAAITVFARANYREASTAAIAAELGVSEPTLFRRFPTKRALYLAAIDRSAELLRDEWQAIEERAGNPLEALVEMGRAYFFRLENDSRHLLLRFRSCTEVGDPEIVAHVRRHYRAVFERVHRLLESARTSGLIAADSATEAYAWLFMAVGSLLDVTQIIGLRSDLSLETMPVLMMMISPKPSRA